MAWVILSTVFLWLIVNLPTIYSVVFVHKLSGISQLWGYSPHQFLFLLILFPFATFALFTAIHQLVSGIAPQLEHSSFLKQALDNWVVVILLGFIIASLFTGVVYFTSSMSLDKLKPIYANHAIACLKALEEDINSKPSDDQDQYRRTLVQNARNDAKNIQITKTPGTIEFNEWLLALQPAIYLQIVQNASHQRNLMLMDLTIHRLNIIQMFFALLVAFLCLATVVTCAVVSNALHFDGSNMPIITKIISALFFSLVIFSIYPICFSLYKSEIEMFVGRGFWILQDIIAMIVIIVILTWVRLIDPSNRQLTSISVFRYIPIVLVGAGSFLSLKSANTLRQLIGSQTKVGTQLLIMMLLIMFGFILCITLWPRKL